MFQLRDDQEIPLAVEALDIEGNPAAVSTIWETSDNSVAAVDQNGLVTASPGAGGLGNATISATVRDDSDGDTHVATFEIEVVGSDAVTFNIVAGEARAKTVAAPEEPEPAP